jgi:aminopeptidase YwaD
MDKTALDIRSRISSRRMADDVKKLVALGPRHAGTEREHEAAQYVERQFRDAGAIVRTDKVENIISWKLNNCRVKVVEPVEQELTSIALLGSGSTPPQGTTAELLYVGDGRPMDYEGVDIGGKFVMRNPPRALMLDNASDETAPQGPTEMYIEKKVADVIEHSRLPGRILQMPLLSGPEGIPFPAVAVTYEDGQFLKELLREWYAVPRGFKRRSEVIPVKLRVWVDTAKEPSYGVNVVGRIEGVQGKEGQIVCLVAHHDNANGPGACDNATAVAVNLETARVLSGMGRPKRSIEFLSVTGEEYGEIGSEAYVQKYVKSDPSRYAGCVNLDIIGNGDHLYYIEESVCLGKLVKTDPGLNHLIDRTCEDLGYCIESTPLEYAGDDGPFILAGVPTSYLAKLISSSWPWLHTYMDDFAVVDVNGLTVMVEIVANTLWMLANQD